MPANRQNRRSHFAPNTSAATTTMVPGTQTIKYWCASQKHLLRARLWNIQGYTQRCVVICHSLCAPYFTVHVYMLSCWRRGTVVVMGGGGFFYLLLGRSSSRNKHWWLIHTKMAGFFFKSWFCWSQYKDYHLFPCHSFCFPPISSIITHHTPMFHPFPQQTHSTPLEWAVKPSNSKTKKPHRSAISWV